MIAMEAVNEKSCMPNELGRNALIMSREHAQLEEAPELDLAAYTAPEALLRINEQDAFSGRFDR